MLWRLVLLLRLYMCSAAFFFKVALGFWASCANKYAAAEPHEGYAILKKWCSSKDRQGASAEATESLSSLNSSGSSSSNNNSSTCSIRNGASSQERSFVYTSNVDGLFLRSGFSPSQVFEVHGTLHGPGAWFCPVCSSKEAECRHQDDDGADNGGYCKAGNGMSHSGGGNDSGNSNNSDDSSNGLVAAPIQQFPFPVDPVTLELHDLNTLTATAEAEAGATPAPERTGGAAMSVAVDHGKIEESEDGKESVQRVGGAWPRCKHCGGRARPSVLMFGDSCPPLVGTRSQFGVLNQERRERMRVSNEHALTDFNFSPRIVRF